jgi:hypothetical protein
MYKVDKWPTSHTYLVALLLVFSQSSNADSYFCEAERASGFVYDHERDQAGQFATADYSLQGPQANSDTGSGPYMEIGKCSPK